MKTTTLLFTLVVAGGALRAEKVPTKETDRFFGGSTAQKGQPEGCKIVWDHLNATFAPGYTAIGFSADIWVADECQSVFPIQARVYVSFNANFKQTKEQIEAQRKGVEEGRIAPQVLQDRNTFPFARGTYDVVLKGTKTSWKRNGFKWPKYVDADLLPCQKCQKTDKVKTSGWVQGVEIVAIRFEPAGTGKEAHLVDNNPAHFPNADYPKAARGIWPPLGEWSWPLPLQ